MVEVSRLVINWPCHTESKVPDKESHKHKHLILLKKLKVFKTAITLQDIAFGSGLSSSSTEFRKFAPEIVVNRSNQYVGVYSANLLEVSRVPIN